MALTIRPATVSDVPARFAIRTAVREDHMSLDEFAAAGVTPERVVNRVCSPEAGAWIALWEGEAGRLRHVPRQSWRRVRTFRAAREGGAEHRKGNSGAGGGMASARDLRGAWTAEGHEPDEQIRYTIRLPSARRGYGPGAERNGGSAVRRRRCVRLFRKGTKASFRVHRQDRRFASANAGSPFPCDVPGRPPSEASAPALSQAPIARR